MSDKGPSTAVSAILITIVVIVSIIVFLTLFTNSGSQISDIFDQVFYGEAKNVADAKQNTVDAQTDLFSQVSKCKYDPSVNPHSASNCFCFSGSAGTISTGYFLYLQNNNNALTSTAYDKGGAPLGSVQEPFELGLFAVKKTDAGEELGCIFPPEYFIKGRDDEVTQTQGNPFEKSTTNDWYVYWKDERANKPPSSSGDDYTFGFYGDKQNIGATTDYAYGYYLESAPKLYKLSETQYCLLTDLIEFPLVDTSGLSYQKVYTPTEDQAKQVAPMADFFTDSSKYCTKDPSSTATATNSFAPSGTFYWISQDTGEYGESTTLFGKQFSTNFHGSAYVCGVDAFSFSEHFTDLTDEAKSKIRDIYNSNTNDVKMSDSGAFDATSDQEYEIIQNKKEYSLNPACTFRIKDFDADSYPFLQISCQAQYANQYSSTNCNEIAEGSYSQNLAPTDIENTIPDLNSYGFDPNVFIIY